MEVLNTRSASWVYEELVLACALAMKNNWKWIDARHPEVLELSEILRAAHLVPLEKQTSSFRNPNGVSRKLGDIITQHPSYVGKPTHGGKLDVIVLYEFLDNPIEMTNRAKLIRERIQGSTKLIINHPIAASNKVPALEPPTGWGRNQDRERNKRIEQSGIDNATGYLQKLGWVFFADRQLDGVGYDLEFRNGSKLIKVEVKGVAGNEVTFNLTAKELYLSKSDKKWTLIVVTNALSEAPVVQEFSGIQLNAMLIVATQYRVKVAGLPLD